MYQNVDMKIHHYKDLRESVVLENHGQKIFGIFHKPAHVSKFPVILICHGLGGHKVGRYRIYVNMAHRLAQMGIGTLRIDFRGSGDSDGDFSEMTLEGEVSDALKALHYLHDYPQVDPARMGVIGRSLGGAVAVLAANKFHPIKSLCLWAPIFNGQQWQTKWEQLHSDQLHPKEKEDLMTVEGQTPGYEFYKQFFSLRMEDHLPAISAKPLFLIHGCKDQTVPIDHTEKYIQARLNAEAETKFIQLPESDHDFSPRHERSLVLDETAAWFKQTL